MWFVVLFTTSKFLIFKSATDPISIGNSLSAEIGQVTDFRGLKLDQWPILVMEIGSLNQPLGPIIILRCHLRKVWFRLPISMTKIGHWSDFNPLKKCHSTLWMCIFKIDGFQSFKLSNPFRIYLSSVQLKDVKRSSGRIQVW